MSLTVYFAHTGAVLTLPKPIRYHRLIDFKRHVLEQFGIPDTAAVFVLTSYGLRLNFGMINEHEAVYVFDKRWFNDDAPIPGPLSAQLPPRILAARISAMFTALNLVLLFCSNFINDSQRPYDRALSQVKMMRLTTLHELWREKYSSLQRLPAIRIADRTIRLAEMLDERALESSATYVAKHLLLAEAEFDEMNNELTDLHEGKKIVDKEIESLRKESARRFAKDRKLEHEELHQVHHQDHHQDHNSDIQYDPRELVAFQHELAKRLRPILARVAALQMRSVAVQERLRKVTEGKGKEKKEDKKEEGMNGIKDKEIEEDGGYLPPIKIHEEYLALTIDLPLLVGLVLIEMRREREWSEYFADGVIAHVSEQLTALAEKERQFRRVWMLKLGRLLSRLDYGPLGGGDCELSVSIPRVEVTLGGHSAPMFAHLRELEVTREDLTKYVETVGHGLLHKTYRDLVRSTNNLKKVTEIVGLLGMDRGDEAAADATVVADLRARIRMLENLLHQQNVRNLLGWPVTRGSMLREGERSGETLGKKVDGRVEGGVDGEKKVNGGVDGKKVVGGSPTDLLLKSVYPRAESVLDASVVDKHLDNIRLRKELAATRGEWQEERSRMEKRWHEEMARLEREVAERESQREDVLKERENQIRKKEEILKERDDMLKERDDQLKKRDDQLKERDDQLKERDGQLKEKDNQLKEKDDKLKEIENTLNEKDDLLEKTKNTLNEKDDQLKETENTLNEKNDIIKKIEGMLTEKEDLLKTTKSTLNEKESLLEDALKETAGSVHHNEDELSHLEQEHSHLKSEHTNLQGEHSDLRSEYTKLQGEYERLENELSQLKSEHTKVQEEHTKVKEEHTNLQNEHSQTSATLEALRTEHKSTLADLLSNMAAKEAEFQQERRHLESDLREVRAQLDEKTDDYENLMEMKAGDDEERSRCVEEVREVQKMLESIKKERKNGEDGEDGENGKNEQVDENLFNLADQVKMAISQLVSDHTFSTASLTQALMTLTKASFSFFVEICLVLESMGLLLTHEDGAFRISRVKGLRNKEDENMPSLTVVADVEALKEKVEESVRKMQKEKGLENGDLKDLEKVEDFYPELYDYLQTVTFKKVHEEDETAEHFLLRAISKRFKDVESFAKRQTKENKSKQQDVSRMQQRLATKISMNNFTKGDLVLFLPTRIDREGEVDDGEQPWAAFNIGAPHYFLAEPVRGNRAWMVGRVEHIEQHVVTADSWADHDKNPFQLGVGVVWHMVTASEGLDSRVERWIEKSG